MARAHFVTYLLDAEGRPIPGANVVVREPDTESTISETIYDQDDPDATVKGNPFTAEADGKCELWLTAPKIVDLYVTKTGYEPKTIRAIVHQLTASTLTVADDGTPLAQRTTLNFVNGFTLSDDAGNDETEIAVDLSEVPAFTDHSARHEDGGADEVSLTGLSGTPADLQAHLDDAGDAHDASAISNAPSGGISATTVQAAVNELDTDKASQADLDTDEAALAAHLADPADAHDASAISVADAGGLFTATEVEAALAETAAALNVDEADLAAHLADAADAHDASAISYAGGTGMSATDVEAAIDELANEKRNIADTISVLKSVNETIQSSTVLQDDDELFFAVGANERWEFEFVIGYDASAAADFKFALGLPLNGGASGHVESLVVGANVTEFLPDLQVSTFSAGSGTGPSNIEPVRIRGFYVGGITAGNVKLQWAQTTSEATNTSVRAGSFLVARRVA
jgi:hypothetical protein